MSLTKVSYSMINGAAINAFDYMTQAQQLSIASGNLVEDVTTPLQAAINAAAGKQLWMPKGNYKITGTLTLPQQIRITGEVLRGGYGTTITAAFAGPAISRAPASLTPCEIFVEHLFVFGDYVTYGAGDGFYIKNSPSFAITFCVVAGFNRQIHIDTGSYACLVRDTYVAETWGIGGSNANIRCVAEFCTFDRVESDDATFSIFLASGAYGCNIINCTLEGWSNYGILVQTSSSTDRTIIQGNKLNGTRGYTAISSDANRTNIINNQIILTNGDTGIILDENSYSSEVIGNIIQGGSTGIYLKNSGLNVIGNNVITGDIALDVQGGSGYPTYPQSISNNVVAGTSQSLRHNQNNKTTYIGNMFQDQATGAYKAPYFQSGAPLVLASNGTNLTMLSGAMQFVANSLIVAGGTGSGIVTAGAADSGGTGYRLLRVEN